MSRFSIRPATEADLPQLVDLFPRAFGTKASAVGAGWSDYMRRILFQHPWRDLGLPSLACDGPGGQLIGFLGVLPRRMQAGHRPLTTAVSHHLMVDPVHRRTLAGLALLKAFLSGPQDLSLCEPDEDVCRIWESLGGSSSLLHSFHWVRYLRPAVHLAHRIGDRLPALLASGLAAGASLLDPAVRRSSGLDLAGPPTVGDDLPTDGLLERIQASARDRFLRPEYRMEDLTWLVDLLARKSERGRLRARRVRGKGGETLGHHVYYVRRQGAGDVLQVGAEPGRFTEVVDDLLYDAFTQGVPALTGRLDPSYGRPLSDRDAVFRLRANRLMFATSRPDVERAILAGDAFLSRFEIEWWIPFGEGGRP